jgi:hypothetical protein
MTQCTSLHAAVEKMLSGKEGSVGYVIFNNPERHNAVSLTRGRRRAMLDDFRNDTTSRWWW